MLEYFICFEFTIRNSLKDNCLFLSKTIQKNLNDSDRKESITALETGKIIYLPEFDFKLNSFETDFLFNEIVSLKAKNISYDVQQASISGIDFKKSQQNTKQIILLMMQRFAAFAKDFVDTCFPRYQSQIQIGRTSFRPNEIQGRLQSKRQNDKLLHIDAFPSTPINGLRILRFFSNINPHSKPRVWHIGEDFTDVLKRFLPKLKPYQSLIAQSLKWLKMTKKLRSPYDHYMLQIHDLMKLDDAYQNTVKKNIYTFEAGSSWMVFTDQVSHAALSGQYALEQTFYVPVSAMNEPKLSPLWQLEAAKKTLLTIAHD